MDIEDDFRNIIETVFWESSDVRFTEHKEVEEYIQEKVDKCLKLHNEYQDALLIRLYGLGETI